MAKNVDAKVFLRESLQAGIVFGVTPVILSVIPETVPSGPDLGGVTILMAVVGGLVLIGSGLLLDRMKM